MTTRRIFPLLVCTIIATIASVAQTSTKPLFYKQIKYPPLRQVRIPDPLRYQLPNGMTIFLLEDHTLPLIEASVLVHTGSRFEPADKTGLASITGDVMRTGGTEGKTGDELDEMLEKVGASVETSIGTSSGSAHVSVLREDAALGLGILADVLMHAAFRDDKIELAKLAERSSISRRNDQVAEIAAREFARLIYGPDHPYGRTTEYATIENITRQDLIEFHSKYFVPNNTLLAVWGDFKTDDMKVLLERLFGPWVRREVRFPDVPEVRGAETKSVTFIRKDNVNQSNIYLGHLGGMLNDPDSGPLNVADQAFGGSAASRLFRHVRSAQGLAYSVGSYWGEDFDHPGIFSVSGSTKSGTTVKMIRAIEHEFGEFVTNGITEEELKEAKDSYLNSFVFRYDTKGKIINRLMALEYYGYPKDFIQKQQRDIQAATKTSVDRAVRAHWKPGSLSLLVVGNDAEFGEPLSALGTDVKSLDITIPPPPEIVPDPTPETIAKGREILRKTLTVMGGPSLLGIANLVITGKQIQVTPTGVITMESVTQIVRPNKVAASLKTPMGEMSMFYDGVNAWMKGPAGVQDLPASEREQFEHEALSDVHYILQNFEKPEFAVQYLKDDELDGSRAYVVLVKHLPSGYLMRFTIDAKSGLVLKRSTRESGEDGPMTAEETYSDYRVVNGIQFPFKTVGSSDGKKTSELDITSISVNPGVDEKIFKR
ncbi:MAG TPA: pitrilysin family protein [Bacteroidota bacterium]|nr:pitrilysin family protein [Bacteroidota bacterium]